MKTEREKSVLDLTPEQKRIRIAAACPSVFLCGYPLHGHVQIYLKSTGEAVDPLNDLNVMHEAEKVLSEDDDREYREILQDMCGVYCFHRATAAQRADAFLLTLT